jgi:maltose O-acetyltransferase
MIPYANARKQFMSLKLPRFFSRWLLKQLENAREAGRLSYLQSVATLAPTAQIGPEGVIENIFGDPDRVQVGNNSYIRGRLFTYGHGGRISIGDWCYIGVRSEIWSMNSITIGNRVLISHDVNIHDGTAHSPNPTERHLHYKQILESGHPRTWDQLPGVMSAPIVIEDDVWISFGVTILRGIRIGAGSIIGAGAFVTQNVPSGVVYRNETKPLITKLVL